MASSVIGALRVVLSMNAGQFTNGIKQVQTAYAGLGSRLEQLSERINRASVHVTTGMFAARRFLSLAQHLTTVSTAFEKGMSNVSTLVDTSTESMKAMTEEVLAISGRTPVALDELTAALYDVRSAGMSASDAMTILEKSAQLGYAGLGSTKEAVDLVTSSFNAFKLEGVIEEPL